MKFEALRRETIKSNIKNEVKEFFRSPVNQGIVSALPIIIILSLIGYGFQSCIKKDEISPAIDDEVVYTAQDSSRSTINAKTKAYYKGSEMEIYKW